MPKIKLSHVVSCSSEDPVHNSENLLKSDPKKKFLSKNKGEPSVSLILQFEKSYRICSIDVGNANSAFVEIFAGRSSSKEQNYEILLPMSSFMTPMDAMNLTNTNRVRLFTSDDLSAAKMEKWDRVKIICTQPFNKNIQYGLSFIALNTKEGESADFGKFNVRPESPTLPLTGSLFSKWKEREDPKTITQEIRTSTTPKCNKIEIKPGSSKKPSDTETEIKKQMNRNRQDLFYDSDDDKNAEKIDKVVEQIKKKQKEQMKDETSDKRKQKKNETETNDKRKQMKNEASQRSKQMNEETSQKSKKKKDDANEQENVKRRKIETINKNSVSVIKKPFNELLSDVVFTISGFVNPERGNIRQIGLNMGAKYRKDWDNSCTHLICAFANTPKFQQVQGKGKIIKKEWFYDCNTQRKRLPWRRYALDKNDLNQPESEDEICEETNHRSDYLSGSDTDEEIEKIIKQQTPKNNEAFNVETDEEQLEKNTKDISDIPKLFKTEIFYIDSVFSEKETETLERLIKSFNGVVIKRICPIIDFVITDEESVKNIKSRISSAQFVKKEWIFECHDQLVLVPHAKYVLN